MSFDRETRNKLARMVAEARRRLVADATDSLRRLGLQDDGTLVPFASLGGLPDTERGASEALRELLGHFAAQEPDSSDAIRARNAHGRLVRETGFTTLNRLVALRMAEERGLIIESVRNGFAAAGFQLFERIANGSLGSRAQTYRAYLECLYDELAVDLPSLFGRAGPESQVFPDEATLEAVLGLLNDPALADLWKEDETIGWVYQYYNDPDERKKMREASQAPRNSRELAVRNQFFTPRYVVEFLTDNTLGRTWYEMRQGVTRLRDDCRYLVRRPTEIFLQFGESAPVTSDQTANLSQEELLNQPFYVPFRAKKDPRDLKILDPACGSGHFLLYAFDLLEIIYEEAWRDDSSPRSEVAGGRLSDNYSSLDELRAAIPGLILRHNLHGVDIDPRAVQIAGLALWLRAQVSYQRLGPQPAERARLTKGNLAVAEPMPHERDLLDQFVARLDPPLIGGLVKLVFTKMQLAGEAGTLLRIEDELRDAISSAKIIWQRGPKLQQLALLPQDARAPSEQMALDLDTSGITDGAFWERVEERVFVALREFAAEAIDGGATRRRLFAEDAERGFGFIDICHERFDVVVMNPPLSDCTPPSRDFLSTTYEWGSSQLAPMFLERGLRFCRPGGFVGSMLNRPTLFIKGFSRFREELLLKRATPQHVLDLGDGDFEDVVVEVAGMVLESRQGATSTFDVVRLVGESQRERAMAESISNSDSDRLFVCSTKQLRVIPRSPFAYWLSPEVLAQFSKQGNLRTLQCSVDVGLSTKNDFRHVRVFWEIPPQAIGFAEAWTFYDKGGEYSPFFFPVHLVVRTARGLRELHEELVLRYPYLNGNSDWVIHPEARYGRPGASFQMLTTKDLAPRVMPGGCMFRIAMVGDDSDSELPLVVTGVTNSLPVRAYVDALVGAGGGTLKNYEKDTVARIPLPEFSSYHRAGIYQAVERLVKSKLDWFACEEPASVFCGLPLRPRLSSISTALERLAERVSKDEEHSRREIDRIVLGAYAFSAQAEKNLRRWVRAGDKPDVMGLSSREVSERVLSVLIGMAFNRWDASCWWTGDAPELPFGPLDEPTRWIQPRTISTSPDSNDGRDRTGHEREGGKNASGSFTAAFAGRESVPVILPDDEEHQEDIVRRVQSILTSLWSQGAEAMEQDVCEGLRTVSIREYFRRPAGFFSDHLKRYSKSRRQAPVYWPLSTASGSYTIWLYYQGLTSDTLFRVINRYVEPKVADVERQLREARESHSNATGREASRLVERLEALTNFLGELNDLRDELRRVAQLPYLPDLDDGVIINAAPLHRLFRLPKWAKDTKEVWQKLERGDYDWAHMAYTIWPERVREKCRSDRSLAIAHDLEHLYSGPPPSTGKRRTRAATIAIDEDDE